MSDSDDLANAYAGRLGHVDPTYTDPAAENLPPAPDQPPVEPVEPVGPEEPVEPEEPAESEEVEYVDIDELTVAELHEQLNDLGVEYTSSEHKADLQTKLRAALAEG